MRICSDGERCRLRGVFHCHSQELGRSFRGIGILFDDGGRSLRLGVELFRPNNLQAKADNGGELCSPPLFLAPPRDACRKIEQFAQSLKVGKGVVAA